MRHREHDASRAELIVARLAVVPTRTRKRHAPPCHRPSDPNHALRATLLPILRLQHPRGYRRGRYVTALSVRHGNRVLIPTLTGTGAVYSFDPVGSYEREACRAAGAAQALVQPFLDNQVRYVWRPPILTRLTPVLHLLS